MSQATSRTAPVYDVYAVTTVFNTATVADVLRMRQLGMPPKGQPGFITFFDPGWSILLLRELVAGKGPNFCPQHWYENEPFAKLEEQPRYRQLRMEAVKDSFGKTFAEQQALVPADEEIPTSRIVVMAMAIHFLATDERLFLEHWVRCADKNSDGNRVYVGDFDVDGSHVVDRSDDYRSQSLGLASSRTF